MRQAVYIEQFGKTWMAGRIYDDVFFHEEQGNQRVYKHDSPGGIETVVFDMLPRHGVRIIRHAVKGEPSMLETTLEKAIMFGIRDVLGERERIFIPYAHWSEVPYEAPPFIKTSVKVPAR